VDKYYKVVRKDVWRSDPPTLVSCFAHKDVCVRYKVGKKTESRLPGAKLMVFDNLCDAETFKRSHNHEDYFQIFQCEVTNPTDKGVFLFGMGYKCPGIITSLRLQAARFNDAKKPLMETSPPAGTVFVDSVTLTKLVEN